MTMLLYSFTNPFLYFGGGGCGGVYLQCMVELSFHMRLSRSVICKCKEVTVLDISDGMKITV